MRSAEVPGWLSLVLVLSGCATVHEPAAPPPAAAAAAPVAAAATAASAPAPWPAEPAGFVDAGAQRGFDAARKALAAGRTEEAAFAQAHPELGGPHANLGLIYRHAGKLPDSAAELEKAVQAGPNRAVYFNQLGITYRQQGQFAKARAAYEQAIALDPGYAARVRAPAPAAPTPSP